MGSSHRSSARPTISHLLTGALFCLGLGACSADEGAPPEEPGGSVRWVRFRAAAVDGVDALTIEGSASRVEHRGGDVMEGLEVEVLSDFPREPGMRAVVREKTGRALVRVLDQPVPENDYRLAVLIDDRGTPGADALAFELWAIRSPAPERPYNVVVITLDTLRVDRLGCYGYERDTSPNLDAFAEQCVRFENAFSTSSFTPPSHASLFTSRHVADHGLRTWNELADEQLTLAEVLKDAGYLTAANVNLGLLSDQNLGQGFDLRQEGLRDGRRIVAQVRGLVRKPPATPFFIWMHLYDVHRPYARDPEWTRKYDPQGRAGVGDGEDHYGLTPEEVAEQGLSDADLAFIENRYDAGVGFTDAILAPLLADLSTPERTADTLVIVTADHGEALREHPERVFTHDPFLHSVVTHIPLLVRYPRQAGAGAVLDPFVSLIDLAPTVLDAIGLPAPPTFHGTSLAALTVDGEWTRDAVFMECWGWEKLKAIRSKEVLVIHDLEAERTSYFDLSRDPAEAKPRSTPDGEHERARQAALMRFIDERSGSTGEAPELDPETIEKLRALGYAD